MGKFSEYKIQLANMADGHHEQDFHCGTEFFRNMENTEVSEADIHVHLDIEKKHEAYDCTFTLKGAMQIPCDRCLDPMIHEVDTMYHIIVKYGEAFSDESDDILVIPYNEQSLNVAYMLYDTVMLTIPLRHVHPNGQCNKAMAAVLNRHNANPDTEESEEDGSTGETAGSDD